DALALEPGLRSVEVGADPFAWIFQVQVDGVLNGASIRRGESAAAIIGGDGAVLPHEHVDRVHPMNELVRQNAAGEIAIVSEVEVLWRVPLAPANRTEIAVPVEIVGLLRHSCRSGVSTGAGWVGIRVSVAAPHRIAAVEPPGADQANLAEFASADVFI